MTRSDLEREVLLLPVEDRMRLAETIWESVEVAGAPEEVPDWQRTLLDERIDEDDAAPDAGSPWSEVKKRILATL